MNKMNIRIHYLYHSGFALEVNDKFIIFDFYKDISSDFKNFHLENHLKNSKNIIVFSSHSHFDHFNPVIFEWEKFNPDIQYVLSSDIFIEDRKHNYHIMEPYETTKLDDININSYGSTDIGISFLITIGEISIFHAGDLNWWHWKDDTDEEKELAENNFKSEIQRISGSHIDIAFFPVDPRLEEFYHVGGEYFINTVTPHYFIPMHFGDTYVITQDFADKMKNAGSKIITIKKSGQEILL